MVKANNELRKIVKFLLSLSLLFYGSSAIGQMNLKIGYSPVYGSYTGINDLLAAYDPSGAEVQDGFADLHFIHGIQIGLRYRIGLSALELSWENLSRDRDALAYRAAEESFIDRKYKFSLNTFQLGFESYFGSYGFGSSLSSTNLAIRREIDSNELSLIDDRHWGARIHFNWVLQESSTVSLVIQPFYQFYFDEYALDPLANDLGVNVTNPKTSLNSFGLSIVFYNGPQSR